MALLGIRLAPVLAGDDGAERRGGEDGFDEFAAVLREHCDTVAPPHAQA